MTKTTPLKDLNPGRQALADHKSKLAAINGEMTALQAQISAAQTARTEVASAEEAIRTHLFEAELAGTVDHAERKRLREAVHSARQRAADVTGLEAEHTRLHGEGLQIIAAQKAELFRIVETEGVRLAERYHYHEVLSLRYRAAAERLRKAVADRSGWGSEQDLVLTSAANAIALALAYGEDEITGTQRKAQITQSASEYGEQWADFVGGLGVDAAYTIPDPEA